MNWKVSSRELATQSDRITQRIIEDKDRIPMNSTTTVSIIIPVYNAEEYLEQCIDSITGQTYQYIEVILVDDGSPDKCGDICDEYAEKDARIKVIHKENEGLAAARNTAFDNSTGECITFLDGDDYLEYNACEIAYKTLSENKGKVTKNKEPKKDIEEKEKEN